MLLQIAYFVALGLAGVLTAHGGHGTLLRTFAVLVLNTALANGWIWVTGDKAPLHVLAFLDFASAIAVLLPEVTEAQEAIAEMYFAQLGIHLAYFIVLHWSHIAPALAAEWWRFALNVVGWGQIVALFWGCSDGGKRSRLPGGTGRHDAGRAVHAFARKRTH